MKQTNGGQFYTDMAKYFDCLTDCQKDFTFWWHID